ncbi:MAG: RNA methyltransferase [Bacteroidetes bacterium]|nr:RNA methyltransferase [Bacteroidota bacterium]MBS1975269.1 RNA methyltransferase [Bacteroidota bacterium]
MLVKSQVKYIQSLSQKKVRDKEAVFVAEGPKIINELLHAENTALLRLYALQTWADEYRKSTAAIEGQPIVVNENELERISFLQAPNQVLGIFKKPFFKKKNWTGKISLMLDCIQDPGNLGTMIRTADWFGIENIICSTDSVDAFNTKVVQSSMGSIARVNVQYEDLKNFVQAHAAIPVYATALDGENLFMIKKPNEAFILIGNESKGIHKELFELAERKITIPKNGYAESLNASVAAGIILASMRGAI